MEPTFCDEFDWGFGWIVAEPPRIRRTSHALHTDEGVWLIDPVDCDGIRERVAALGKPVGVIQLLDRHERDCAALATRLGVPLYEVPFDGIPRSPFGFLPIVQGRFWKEVALWWEARRVLAVADALGTVGHFLAPGERLGVHPFGRLRPPRVLERLEPAHILTGHGEGVHGEVASPALREALATARRRIPRWLAGLPRAERRDGRRRSSARSRGRTG